MEKLTEEEYTHGGTQLVYYNDEQKEKCLCPFCNTNDFLLLGSERGLSVVKCKECKLIYTNPRAKNSEQNYFGDEDTFLNECKLIFSGKKTSHRDKNYEYELYQIKKHKKSGNLLDIGTNAGFFLRKARDFGFDTEGVEPSPSLSKLAREQWGLKVHTSFLEHADLPKNHYDVITLIDVFEYTTNPKEIA